MFDSFKILLNQQNEFNRKLNFDPLEDPNFNLNKEFPEFAYAFEYIKKYRDKLNQYNSMAENPLLKVYEKQLY